MPHASLSTLTTALLAALSLLSAGCASSVTPRVQRTFPWELSEFLREHELPKIEPQPRPEDDDGGLHTSTRDFFVTRASGRIGPGKIGGEELASSLATYLRSAISGLAEVERYQPVLVMPAPSKPRLAQVVPFHSDGQAGLLHFVVVPQPDGRVSYEIMVALTR